MERIALNADGICFGITLNKGEVYVLDEACMYFYKSDGKMQLVNHASTVDKYYVQCLIQFRNNYLFTTPPFPYIFNDSVITLDLEQSLINWPTILSLKQDKSKYLIANKDTVKLLCSTGYNSIELSKNCKLFICEYFMPIYNDKIEESSDLITLEKKYQLDYYDKYNGNVSAKKYIKCKRLFTINDVLYDTCPIEFKYPAKLLLDLVAAKWNFNLISETDLHFESALIDNYINRSQTLIEKPKNFKEICLSLKVSKINEEILYPKQDLVLSEWTEEATFRHFVKQNITEVIIHVDKSLLVLKPDGFFRHYNAFGKLNSKDIYEQYNGCPILLSNNSKQYNFRLIANHALKLNKHNHQKLKVNATQPSATLVDSLNVIEDVYIEKIGQLTYFNNNCYRIVFDDNTILSTNPSNEEYKIILTSGEIINVNESAISSKVEKYIKVAKDFKLYVNSKQKHLDFKLYLQNKENQFQEIKNHVHKINEFVNKIV